MLARLGKGGFIGIAEQVGYFLSQAALHLFHCPSALSGELTQRLHVGSWQAGRQGLNRLALSLQQQALDVNLCPVAPFTASHRFE